MLIYAAIGAFGLIFLLVMLFVGEVFGGDHDVHAGDVGGHGDIGHDAGPSVFSARIMASFLTAFGVGGVVARYYGLSHPASSGCGVAAGIVMSGLVYQFARILYSQQASSEVQMSRLVGRTAEVSVGIPAGGLGQVTLEYGGERTTQIARSKDGSAIPPGALVVVTALAGDSIVVERAAPAAGGPS
ncbi:MAG TPA: NfeD family protein [Candidatus Sulfotelmatobacter sp.]|jgi:membrane protein implicated in regulation of membrane protease activity|nr:NfeD family protein [Candidatus Sulfotelmatobacter sp.]